MSWHKAWQNKRPGWTRRVRWYELYNAAFDYVRLEFCERMPDNTGRETYSVTVTGTQARELWEEYVNDETVTGQDIFLRVMAQQEEDNA